MTYMVQRSEAYLPLAVMLLLGAFARGDRGSDEAQAAIIRVHAASSFQREDNTSHSAVVGSPHLLPWDQEAPSLEDYKQDQLNDPLQPGDLVMGHGLDGDDAEANDVYGTVTGQTGAMVNVKFHKGAGDTKEEFEKSVERPKLKKLMAATPEWGATYEDSRAAYRNIMQQLVGTGLPDSKETAETLNDRRDVETADNMKEAVRDQLRRLAQVYNFDEDMPKLVDLYVGKVKGTIGSERNLKDYIRAAAKELVNLHNQDFKEKIMSKESLVGHMDRSVAHVKRMAALAAEVEKEHGIGIEAEEDDGQIHDGSSETDPVVIPEEASKIPEGIPEGTIVRLKAATDWKPEGPDGRSKQYPHMSRKEFGEGEDAGLAIIRHRLPTDTVDGDDKGLYTVEMKAARHPMTGITANQFDVVPKP